MVRYYHIGLVVQPTLFKAPSGSRRRHDSAVDSSLVKLSADINLVYKYLKKKLYYSVSRLRLANIKYQIVSDMYDLSPLEVQFMDKGDLYLFLMDNLLDESDVMIETCPH